MVLLVKKVDGDKMQDEPIRLNKYIAEAGICSRREADRLIESKRVSVDGETAAQGMRIEPGQIVKIDGKCITVQKEKVYLAFYKPRGIVCTSEKREKNNIIEYLHYPVRITYCGRLDKDSEGLVIMTNDGDVVHGMMRGANFHEKEYIVSLDKPITQAFLEGMQAGVYLKELDMTTRKCKVEKINDTSCRIILTQGLNRQIRRMCEHFGYRVMKLLRVRVMNVTLGDLKAGKYRALSEQELSVLMKSLQDGSNKEIRSSSHEQQT